MYVTLLHSCLYSVWYTFYREYSSPGLGLAAQLAAKELPQQGRHMLKCRDYLESRLLESFGDKLVINCKESPRLPNTSNFAIFLENCRLLNLLYISYGTRSPQVKCRMRDVLETWLHVHGSTYKRFYLLFESAFENCRFWYFAI